jgi:hypothetical protein
MPMYPEYWRTPVQCVKNDDHRYYEDRVFWRMHYIGEIPESTNQVPEIRTVCRDCDSPLEVADGWLPYPR